MKEVTLKRIVTMAVAVTLLASTAYAQQAYEGQIDGDYNGWEGETIYKLMDGHIIKQSEYRYHYKYVYSPKVIIYRSAGGYKIVVVGDDNKPIGIEILK